MKNYEAKSRCLDVMTIEGHGRNVERFTPDPEILMQLAKEFGEKTSSRVSVETVLRIYEWSADTMITFRNKATREIGVIAILPLNSAGHIALAEGKFDAQQPSTRYICRGKEKPVSVYVWAINVSAQTGGGVAHVMKVLKSSRFAQATLYCSAANDKAEQFFISMGFQKGALIFGRWHSGLMVYHRPSTVALPSNDNSETEGAPAYDSHKEASGAGATVGVKVVHTLEELLQVFAIRAATYVAEQKIPFYEDFDGNDFCGTQFIGYVGDEPAACLRIRYFSSFVKIERLAVMPRFRQTSVAMRLVRGAIQFSRKKGFTRFYGHTELATFPVWKRAGFVLRENSVACSDREFFEGDLITRDHDDPITANSDPYVIIRPEGQWYKEGVLDRSSHRGTSAA